MSEMIMPGPVNGMEGVREAMCIHTKRIYDSCRDKDCIEDLRFYPLQSAQSAIDRAISIKAGKAELLYSYIDVEPLGFHRGYYSVDVRYFYKVTAEAFVGAARPVEISGLAVFDKRVILFGSEGGAKEFTSDTAFAGLDEQTIRRNGMPTAVVEVVDPIVLGMKLVDVGEGCCDCELSEIPSCICACFGGDLAFGGDGKRIYVTLGQFSIIRLERDAKLLIPVYNYCMPEKECTCGNGEEDPCDVFRQVQFPVNEFFPPSYIGGTDPRQEEKGCGGCGT